MTLKERTDAFVALGEKLNSILKTDNTPQNSRIDKILINCYLNNKWFDEKHTKFALNHVVEMLSIENLNKWLAKSEQSLFSNNYPKRVGVVMAGNIPMVGFHDFLCILITGHIFIGKLSSQDMILMPFIADLLCEIDVRFKKYIFFKDDLREGFDAVIATGSTNTSRYFEYYFGKYPHIIRKNRNSIAVLSGNETIEQLDSLADDICLYFGKGCRSISKIYVPQNFNFENLIDALNKYKHFTDNSKYYNNYEYYKSIYIINNLPYHDNGFIILKEEEGFSSPVSVLFYEFYNDIINVNSVIAENLQHIQCVVSEIESVNNSIDFGKTQKPDLWDYADNVNTMDFLLKLNN